MQQRWFITGASRGLGRSLAEAVLAAGHCLTATARDPAVLSDLIDRYPKTASAFALDVTDPGAASAAIRHAQSSFGWLDVVVNNAGYGDVGSVEDTSLDSIRQQIDTNLFGVINVTKAAIPVFRHQHSGRFIQISSVGGRIGATGRAAYSAAKFGIEGFSEALAKEMHCIGVLVTIVEPGGFRTDFAGSSSMISDGRKEYAGVIGAVARMQRAYHGTQPNDPAKGAAIILRLGAMAEPPLRLLLGEDAIAVVSEADALKAASDRAWRHLSLCTSY